MNYVWASLISIGFIFPGCTSMKPVDVAKPSEVTVDAALNDVAQGLNNFRKVGAATNTRYGLIVDEVTVTLKVTASADDSSKLVLDVANVSPAVLQGGNAAIHAEQGGESHGSRDNTIIVKLKNVYTAQLNPVGLREKPSGGKIGVSDVLKVSPGQKSNMSIPLTNGQSIDCARPKTAFQKTVCEKYIEQGQ
jgi:hypothetical protein